MSLVMKKQKRYITVKERESNQDHALLVFFCFPIRRRFEWSSFQNDHIIALKFGFNKGRFGRTASRSKRFTRLRVTAPPTFLLTEKPILMFLFLLGQ